MARTKAVETTIQSMDEAGQILKEITELENKKKAIEVWAKNEELNIRASAEKKLILDKSTGETINDKLVALGANLLAFIEKNKDMFSTGQRSRTLIYGEIGYRLGQPRVDVIGKITQKAILTTAVLLKKLKSWGYIAVKASMDKEAMLSDYSDDKKKTLVKLNQVSLTVVQDDEPFFKTKNTIAKDIKKQAA